MVVDLYNILSNVCFPVLVSAFLAWITYRQSESLKDVALKMNEITNTLLTINNRLDMLEHTVDKIDCKVE